jgi:hypothetical protein
MARIEPLRQRVFFKLHPTKSSQASSARKAEHYVLHHMRQEVLLAVYGGDRAQQGMAGLDVQLQRAVAEMPKAADLALRSWRHKRTSIRQIIRSREGVRNIFCGQPRSEKIEFTLHF